MRSRIKNRIDHALESKFPERRLFLKSDTETRFIRLKPSTQLLMWVGGATVLGWTIFVTAILLMDSVGSGNLRAQAERDQVFYEERLNALSAERDLRAQEATAAQARFNDALQQISTMQSALLESENRRSELERGIEVIQGTLVDAVKERDTARASLAAETGDVNGETGFVDPAVVQETSTRTIALISNALTEIAEERDQVEEDAEFAIAQASDAALELQLLQERNDVIFSKLEDAMTVSVEPLDRMFRNAGLNTNSLLNSVRSGYSGQGGPLAPIQFSTSGGAQDPDTLRANKILSDLDRINLYRIAAERAPFSMPVFQNYRFTSGFGMRWGRLHAGTDFAGPVGTPIHSTADGVVTFAGWSSGYGRLIKIQHEFGIETRYAHLSRIRVNVGQRVSRGDRIGDMGNSGRSTGPHLHYEVRVGGKPINPMIYIRAGQDVL